MRLPRPRKTHQSHCSTVRGTQLKALPPKCTITTWRRQKTRFDSLNVDPRNGTKSLPVKAYLHNKGSQDNGAEDGVVENALKDVPFSVDLASVELVEDLHEDECVEHNGVVFRGWSVKRGVPARVDVEHLLTYKRTG